MTGKEMKNHNCDNINCNHNDTKGLCCLFNPDNCKYRQLQKENAELKSQVSFLEDNLRVARKDRKNLQLDIGKGLQEFIKDCPYTALKFYANEKYVEENAELKEQNTNLQEMLKTERSVTCKEEYLKKVTELEQDNAELKEQNIKDCENFNKTMKETKEQWKEEHNQLIKAKELIRNLLRVTYGEGWNYSLDWKVKAEQFLKLDNDEIYEHIQKAKYNYIN